MKSTAFPVRPTAGRANQLFKTAPWVQLSMGGLDAASHLFPERMTDIAYFLWCRPRRRSNRYKSELYPGAKPFVCSYRAGRLRGFRWGDGSRKALLIHGWESNLGRMLPFVEPLLTAGYQVISVDGPAHGLSDFQTTDVYDFGSAMGKIIEEEDGVELIVAHSYGAAATLFMLHERPGLAPQQMVCLAPMADMEIHLSIYQLVTGLSDRMMGHVVRRIEQQLPTPPGCRDWNLLHIPPQLNFPSLIVHDTEDQIVPVHWGHRMATAWTGAELMLTSGLGHNRILREPAIARRMVEWVS